MKKFTPYSVFGLILIVGLLLSGCIAAQANVVEDQLAEEAHQHDDGSTNGISATESDGVNTAFDIVHAKVVKDGDVLHFQQAVVGEAGSVIPDETGPTGRR